MNIDKIELKSPFLSAPKNAENRFEHLKNIWKNDLCEKVAEVARLVFVAICWGVFIYIAQFYGLRRDSLLSCASLAYTIHMIIQST